MGFPKTYLKTYEDGFKLPTCKNKEPGAGPGPCMIDQLGAYRTKSTVPL